MKKVTFGIVNCNRLFYLKSCLESLISSTSDYDNKEIIVVDNASVEEGTKEYLDEKEAQGIIVFRNTERDPSNEFAKGLNLVVEKATGDFVCPLQGDLQFIADSGWLKEYVDFFDTSDNTVGCALLDAQRQVRIGSSNFSKTNNGLFLFDLSRNPIAGAADVFYSKEVIELIYPWHVDNEDHEGGQDSETEMLKKCKNIVETKYSAGIYCAVPAVSPAIAIYTDSRGTNARIRGNKRYGDYWEALDSDMYYKRINYSDVCGKYVDSGFTKPLSIESLAASSGAWELPKDEFGNWKKNPIRPETATSSDYVVLYDDPDEDIALDNSRSRNHEYVDEWLEG